MTTLTDYLRQDGVPADAAAAAQAFNDLADHFAPVPSYRVLAWMGEGGRLAKLKGFVALTANAEDAPTIGLRSAIETVLLAVANPSTEIDMTPGSPHRFLLGVLVTAGALSQDDADALVWRGWVDGFTAATAEGVTSTRATIAADDAWQALNTLRFDADAERSTKLNWLRSHPDTALPSDLAGLDAFEIPAEEPAE